MSKETCASVQNRCKCTVCTLSQRKGVCVRVQVCTPLYRGVHCCTHMHSPLLHLILGLIAIVNYALKVFHYGQPVKRCASLIALAHNPPRFGLANRIFGVALAASL